MIWMDNIKTFWKWYLCWCIFTFDLSIILSNCFANCKSYFPWIQFRSNWNTIDFVFCPRLQICIWAEKKNKATFYSLLQSISDCQNAIIDVGSDDDNVGSDSTRTKVADQSKVALEGCGFGNFLMKSRQSWQGEVKTTQQNWKLSVHFLCAILSWWRKPIKWVWGKIIFWWVGFGKNYLFFFFLFFFRCDSISLHLPLSVSGWVAQSVSDS